MAVAHTQETSLLFTLRIGWSKETEPVRRVAQLLVQVGHTLLSVFAPYLRGLE